MAISLSEHPSIALVVSLTALYIFYHLLQTIFISYRRHLFKREKGCRPEPRYPQKDKILGSDLFLENVKFAKQGGFLEMIKRRYARVGATTWSSRLPGQVFLQTIEPENVKAMLATQFKDFELPRIRKNAFAPIFGHGIFTTDGTEWETSRSLLRPNFNRAQVADLDLFEKHVSKVIARIPKDGSTVDLQTLFFMLTLDSATEFLFGQSAGSLDLGQSFERGMRFAQAFTDSTTQTGNIVRVPQTFAFLLKNKKYKDDVKYVHAYVSDYVRTAVNLHKNGATEKSGRYVFLEELAKTGCGEKKIQDELLNILLAGRDTTAGLLSYLFYTLAREPQVFKKLQAEISELDGQRPTYEQIKGMRYLQWVLNEGRKFKFPQDFANSSSSSALPDCGYQFPSSGPRYNSSTWRWS